MVPTFCMDDIDVDDVSTTKHDVRHRVIKWLRLRHDRERGANWVEQKLIELNKNVLKRVDLKWLGYGNHPSIRQQLMHTSKMAPAPPAAEATVAQATTKAKSHNSNSMADNPFIVVLSQW